MTEIKIEKVIRDLIGTFLDAGKISINLRNFMDYKKKSLSKLSNDSNYEEIDTRLASGWYVDSVDSNKKKKYRTKKVSFKISKKI